MFCGGAGSLAGSRRPTQVGRGNAVNLTGACCLPFTALAFSGLFCSAAAAQKDNDGGPVVGPRSPLVAIEADKAADYFKDHPIYSGRKNGVRLEAAVSVVDQREPDIRVKW